jgi:hypothetical protein
MNESVGKVGRPTLPKKEKNGKFISTRLSLDEYKEVVEAAKQSGMRKRNGLERNSLPPTAALSPAMRAHRAIGPAQPFP